MMNLLWLIGELGELICGIIMFAVVGGIVVLSGFLLFVVLVWILGGGL